jgi:hypothetical protein
MWLRETCSRGGVASFGPAEAMMSREAEREEVDHPEW